MLAFLLLLPVILGIGVLTIAYQWWQLSQLRSAIRARRLGQRQRMLGGVAVTLAAIYLAWTAWRVDRFLTYQRDDVTPRELSAAARFYLPLHDYFVLSAIVRNPNTRRETLSAIASNPDPGLGLPHWEWISLFDPERSIHEDMSLSQEVAKTLEFGPVTFNPLANFTEAELTSLAADQRIAPSLLRRVAAHSKRPPIQQALAGNPSTPGDVLAALPRTDPSIALALAGNRQTPKEILEQIARHPDPKVADAARRRLQ
jgi:hypothetical protein